SGLRAGAVGPNHAWVANRDGLIVPALRQLLDRSHQLGRGEAFAGSHFQVQVWRLHPVVEALQALRGVQCTVAVTMVAEIGALTRFEHPRELMKCLGLIPSEYSTGDHRRQGAMTKAGNTHTRRALVEGAWAYRYPATVSRHLQLCLENQPKVIQDISWKA